MRTPKFAAIMTAFATMASAAAFTVSAGTAEAATTTGNLVYNPSFAVGKTGWAASANSTFTVAQNGYQSTNGANLVPVTSGNVNLSDSPETEAYTTAGATYTATVRVKNATAGTTIKGALSLTERTADGVTPMVKSTAFTLSDTMWRTITVTGVAAGNTVGAAGGHGLSLDVAGFSMARTQKLLIDDFSLRRTEPNLAPQPSFTSATTYLAAKFDASGSVDPDGSIASYSWDFGDGTTGTGRLPSRTYTTAGTKTVTLTVRDDDGEVRSVTKTVQVVANVAPTASFESSSTYLAAKFDASGSVDSDGSIASYSWDFGDGTTGTGRLPSKTYTTAGEKTVTLTVKDNAGETTSLTKAVSVADNVAPTASFTSTETYLTAKLEATAADSDGTVVSYAWDFGDGTSGTGRTAWHTYDAAGTYAVALTVKDNAGDATTVKHAVTVVANIAPSVVINSSTDYLAARFNPSGSTDSDGTINSYVWDFGDGTTERGSWASHTYAAAGTYTVELTATDNGGASTTRTAQVTVVANVPPVVEMTSDTSYLTASLTATGSDSDGRITSYQWNFGDGDVASGRLTTHTYASGGTYTVSVTATDDGGDRTTVHQVVTVVPNVAPTAAFVSSASYRTARFDASLSADSDGTIESWAWQYGDGSTGEGRWASHTYATAGTRVVTLTVTDDFGATATYTMQVTVTAGPTVGLGVYNGAASERPDETTFEQFGAAAQVTSSYYVSSQNLSVTYETARIRRGTSPNITMTTRGTQLIHGIATGDPTAIAWVDRYVAQLKTLAAVDPNIPVYATIEHEFRAKVKQGLVTGASADTLTYAKALSVFYAKARAAHPNIVTSYWMVGYDRTFEGTIGAALTQRPGIILFDPYANEATDTVASVALPDVTWLRAQGWYDDQPIALAEFGMPVGLGDAALAKYYSNARAQLDSIGLSWGVFFNREQDNNHKITTGAYPQAVQAFSLSLAGATG